MGKTYFHHIFFFMPDKRSTSEKRNNKRFTPDNEVRRSFQITRGRFSLKVLFQQFIRDARDTEWQVKERGNSLFDTYTLCFHQLTHIFLVVMINIHPVNLVTLLCWRQCWLENLQTRDPFQIQWYVLCNTFHPWTRVWIAHFGFQVSSNSRAIGSAIERHRVGTISRSHLVTASTGC